jgi:hypothetical protein
MPISPTQPTPATEPPKDAGTQTPEAGAAEAVFGFVLFGGALSGALVRDVRLANELADRGWPVHAWWVMDRPLESPLRPQVRQHWLFHALRYVRPGGSDVAEAVGRFMSRR